jgi:hypothetical protein
VGEAASWRKVLGGGIGRRFACRSAFALRFPSSGGLSRSTARVAATGALLLLAVEDLLYAHRTILTRSGQPMREDGARFFETVDAGKARFLVARVANWTPTRCASRLSQNDFYYLIRIFDKTSGKEITRSTTSESGRVNKLVHRPENEEQAEFSMKELAKLSVSKSLPSPQKAQFVRTWGPKLRCDSLDPCIAFQSGGRSYLSQRGTVYRLETEKPVSFRASLGNPDVRAAFLQSLEGKPETVVSVGGDQMVIAVPVS